LFRLPWLELLVLEYIRQQPASTAHSVV
jgi:hypothetical protein